MCPRNKQDIELDCPNDKSLICLISKSPEVIRDVIYYQVGTEYIQRRGGGVEEELGNFFGDVFGARGSEVSNPRGRGSYIFVWYLRRVCVWGGGGSDMFHWSLSSLKVIAINPPCPSLNLHFLLATNDVEMVHTCIYYPFLFNRNSAHFGFLPFTMGIQ